MDIKSYVENLFIKQRETNAVILEIYETGSQLFREEPHDLDFQVVCSGYSQRFTYNKITEDGVDYDIFIIDKIALSRELTFGNPNYFKKDLKLWNYFHAIRKSIYGDCKLPYDMLSYEDTYISYIKEHFSNRLKTGRPLPKTHGKMYVHYYIILKIYENKNTTITDDMKYDLELLYSNSELSYPIIDWVISNLQE